ncbi:uncharacterized protein LOC106651544 [Trichogramma pretiosum]|uniref:uncharacterized protein LOC106651544 n=1 Tax=Trichogramma pretiosum TaxID=7493 RepID=UPI0006C9CD65|nr:uncharacterized protein LOC106651544 [Trichogramma pretiosum]
MKTIFILSVTILFSQAFAEPEPDPFSVAETVHEACLKGNHDASTPEEYCDSLSQVMTKQFHQTCYKIKDHCPIFKDACHKYISEGLCKHLFLDSGEGDTDTNELRSKPIVHKLLKAECLKKATKYLAQKEDGTFDANASCQELSKHVGQVCTEFVDNEACPRMVKSYIGRKACEYGLVHYLCKN